MGNPGVRWAVSACAAVVLVAGCTASPATKPAPTKPAPTTSAPQLTGTPAQICRSHFPTATLAIATSYGAAFHAGTSGPDVTGKGAYPAGDPAVQCLVPRDGVYHVEVIVLSDGAVLESGTQAEGDRFEPRA